MVAQVAAVGAATDSSPVFTQRIFQQLVLNNHPVVQQARLISEAARADVLQSLGKFDPLLEAAFDRKEFGNRDYYSNWSNQLKVPLWLAGADLKIGYDRNTGENVNPQYITPDQGLSGVGITVPLGQGFLIDARRNTLRQSRAMLRYADAEKIKQMLFVWYSAVTDYWTWYLTYSEYQLLKEGVQLASTRFAAAKGQTDIGDTPPIDTVEAKITVQEREIELTKLQVELDNRRLILSNYLWDEDGNPLELPGGAVPEQPAESALRPEQVRLDSLVGFAAESHPELLKMRADSTRLVIERSFRREMLKPTINLSGTLIAARDRLGPITPKYYDFGWRNYKVGVDVAVPLFLRAERGKLKQVVIRQDQLRLNLQQTNRDIRNELITVYNTLNAYKSQLIIQGASIENQQRLLDAEQQKLQLGESTLFLVNSRETKLIDMKIKRASIIAGFQKTLASLYYKAGTGPTGFIPN
ncbi:MAG: TolC family protein [Sphingobacteriales bacterium]|nr:MAG: TolC family protein [Sphingobacteriales bacterium]